MPDLSQLVNVLGPLVAILAIVLGAVFGTGSGSSSSSNGATAPGGDTVTSQPARPSIPQTRPAPSYTPDIDRFGCDKNSPSYFQCAQAAQADKERRDKEERDRQLRAVLDTPAKVDALRQKQYEEIVWYRGQSVYDLPPLVRDPQMDREAQAFAEYLANLPGDEIFHANAPGVAYRDSRNYAVENVARMRTADNFARFFSQSPGHASNMTYAGPVHPVRVGIGIAQDPVTLQFYGVQRFK